MASFQHIILLFNTHFGEGLSYLSFVCVCLFYLKASLISWLFFPLHLLVIYQVAFFILVAFPVTAALFSSVTLCVCPIDQFASNHFKMPGEEFIGVAGKADLYLGGNSNVFFIGPGTGIKLVHYN